MYAIRFFPSSSTHSESSLVAGNPIDGGNASTIGRRAHRFLDIIVFSLSFQVSTITRELFQSNLE